MVRLVRKMPDTPAFQFVDLRQQHETAQLGMWVFLASEVLFFGGLILGYCVNRYAYPEGFAEAARHTQIAIGTANTAILLTSSFFVAWAVSIVKMGAGRVAGILLTAAAALGCVFLVLKGIEYKIEYEEHLVPSFFFVFRGPNSTSAWLFFSFYFVATALHGLHVAIGIIVLIVIAVKARRGGYSKRYHSPATVAGLYWHFVDLVWVFLYALIYLPGRAS
jgi:cytochrome c oxidase subunit 3